MANYFKISVFVTMFLLWGCMESDEIILDETTEEYQLYDYYVDENGKITDSSPSEHSLKQLMIANAKVSCFLCGHQKFNTSHPFTVSHCKDIDYVFSDVPLTDALLGKQQK